MFDVIPVIDVRHGLAVRAVAGDRANYRPLVSPLSASADPLDVAHGLMALHAFPVIYIADLDGIEGRGANMGLIQQATGPRAVGWVKPSRATQRFERYPLGRGRKGAALTQPTSHDVWSDTGARTAEDVAALLSIAHVHVVIGSETGVTPAELSALQAEFGDRVILSLDFRGDTFMGDPPLLADPACWPSRVIAMTLANVGVGKGPDLARISAIKRHAGGRDVFAAGGIRHRADLDDARAAGAGGALISSALHAQTITAGDLREVSGR